MLHSMYNVYCYHIVCMCVCVCVCDAAELDMYRVYCYILERLAGIKMPPPQQAEFNGIPVTMTPRVVLSPEFAPTLAYVKDKVRTQYHVVHTAYAYIKHGTANTGRSPVRLLLAEASVQGQHEIVVCVCVCVCVSVYTDRCWLHHASPW